METINRRSLLGGVLGFLAAPFASKVITKNNQEFVVGELMEFLPGDMVRATGLSDVAGMASKAESVITDFIPAQHGERAMVKNLENYKLVALTSVDVDNMTAETPTTGNLEEFFEKMSNEVACKGVLDKTADTVEESPRLYWDTTLDIWREYEKFPDDAKLEWDGNKWFAVSDSQDGRETGNSPLSNDEVVCEGRLGNPQDYPIEYIVSAFGIYDFTMDEWENIYSAAMPSYELDTENNLL